MHIKAKLIRGAGYGLLATLAMTIVMSIGMGTGLAPMPEPIPTALARLFLEGLVGSVSGTVTLLVGMIGHFGYGAAAGGLFVLLFGDRAGWRTGLIWGSILWIIMQLMVLPVVGWGMFGLSVTGFPPKIAAGTLVLHLIYGLVLGWGCRQ